MGSGGSALITGGSGGIGLAVARRLAADGYGLALAARSAERLDRAAAALEGTGVPVVTLPCDITRADQTEALVAGTVERLGGLDVLVNAAGTNRPGVFLRARTEDWDEVLRVNLTGVMLTTRAALGVMRRRGHGTIVTIASLGARQARPGLSSYCASKFGVLGLMEAVRLEVERLGIHVTTILPAEVDTAMHPDAAEKGPHRIPPEDVAEAVSFALRISNRTALPCIELHNQGLA